ncbi:Hpt domain-containing protein, partial [Nodularia harveyana UHCC-0300]
MLPEQQQRILGYFIEEAKEHLNTIEQALLNLQSTLNDPEMVNEIFRAAHSIKGSAAMLGLNSIQHTSHRLEDCFKVLKEHPVQVDQKLESLFLGVCDTLKVLLEHLSGPFGLSEESANTLMSETEPVFEWLNEHLDLLVQQSTSGVAIDNQKIAVEANGQDSVNITDLFLREDISHLQEETEALPQSSSASISPATANDYGDEFQAQVLQTLRQMLQLFKKQITPESRNSLQECCQQLIELGKRWDLSHWCSLCQAAANAIANPENTYLTLAKIVITEIKQAQELVLQNRESEIQISQQLAALINLPELDLSQTEDLLPHQSISETELIADEELSSTTDNSVSESTTLQPTDSITSLTELSDQIQPSQETSTVSETALAQILLDGQQHQDISNIGQNGPEVGLAELNTLADLFEGETPELDETWEEEEKVETSTTNELGIDLNNNDIEEIDNDLADFLSLNEDENDNDLQVSLTKTEELNVLFGNNLGETESLDLNQPITAETSTEPLPSFSDTNSYDLNSDLLAVTPDENELTLTGAITDAEQIATNQHNTLEKTDDADIEDILLDNSTETIQPDILSIDALFDDFDHTETTPQVSQDESEISDLFDITPASVVEFTQAEDNFNDFWNEESTTGQQNEILPLVEEDVAKALEDSLFAAASGSLLRNIGEPISSPLSSIKTEDEALSSDENDLFGDDAAFNLSSASDDDLEEISAFAQESEDDLFGDDAAFNLSSTSDDDLEEISAFEQEPETVAEPRPLSSDANDLFGDDAAFNLSSASDDDLEEISAFDQESETVAEPRPLSSDENDLFGDDAAFNLSSTSDDDLEEISAFAQESEDDLFGDNAAFNLSSTSDDDLEEISAFEQELETVAEPRPLSAEPRPLSSDENDLFGDDAAFNLLSTSDDDLEEISAFAQESEDDLFGDDAAFNLSSTSDDDLEEISAFEQESETVAEPRPLSSDANDLFGDDAAFNLSSTSDDDLEEISAFDQEPEDDLFGDDAAFNLSSTSDDDLEEISAFDQESETVAEPRPLSS